MRFGLFFIFISLFAASGVANAGNILLGSGFESSDLAPWEKARDNNAKGGYEWMIGASNVYSGNYSASVGDNYELRQNFSAISASSVGQVKFAASFQFMSFNFFYNDGSDVQTLLTMGDNTWHIYDVTEYLDVSKELTGISFWGHTDTQVFIDDIVVASQVSRVPEPSSLILAAIGLFGLVSLRRFRVK